MSARAKAARREAEPGRAVPLYELRAVVYAPGDLELEVWQLAAAATPNVTEPRRIAGLRGRNLDLVSARLLKALRAGGMDVASLGRGVTKTWKLPEDDALRFGLLFRMLAPMRSARNIRGCAEGIERMGKEEAAYWLGMAMHRKYPRRVLMALRFLLIDPNAA